MAETDTEENTFLNKVVFFFVHKKYCHSFIKLRLNHWCHMDYFNNVLTTFQGLEGGSSVAVYAGSVSSHFIKNIVICVLKINKSITGLERHEGEWLIMSFSFWGDLFKAMTHQASLLLNICQLSFWVCSALSALVRPCCRLFWPLEYVELALVAEPDIWSATLGATPKNNMLLFHFLSLIVLKEAFILAANLSHATHLVFRIALHRVHFQPLLYFPRPQVR